MPLEIFHVLHMFEKAILRGFQDDPALCGFAKTQPVTRNNRLKLVVLVMHTASNEYAVFDKIDPNWIDRR